ncbi:S-adenosyl-L-methionine-dependent methyltransferase ftsjd2 [Operophtera brumata]|uniref:Cap-specific mRNA (nucleoside-2'-O-)-methyltransferase 1 n=1 Tax=Operophtera brumata TaxID=104452 RepID=A0A0L7LNS6_OPEBR|nr:S-adenosyl-L-methionine-dependent methyltransferase ftsjd2 [Operophtera brumata]
MNLSDPSDDDSSSDESRTMPAKRPRADTLGASSTTSHGSKSPAHKNADKFRTEFQKPAKVYGNYTPRSSEENSTRLSRSSLSENCSSANEDDCRPVFDDNDGEVSMRPPSFQDSESFFKKSCDQGFEDAYNAEYSEKSKRMMSNMGFKPGKGLGKFEHGRTEPIEASAQKGRRGLGAMPSVVGSIPKDLMKWSPEDTKASPKEEVAWLPTAAEEPPSGDVLDEWLKKGPKKLDIENETSFVDSHILKGVLEAKTIFDSLDDKDLRHARFRSNPYETIGAVVFLNRAAVKMANIDAVFDFQFSHPKRPTGEDAVDKKDILYFADVCAGPGGFSEYILYRFGFTLKGPNDFKLSDFYAGTAETFNPYYGVKEDGNVFDPANLTSLKEHGFSVEGQENLQEVLSKQLYLCQCLAALMLVRTGGHFVVKLFDVFTPFSVGLIYIMYRCFDKVCIHKPVTSRPANSERYLICFWKRLGTESVEQHLFSVNSMLWKGVEHGGDVLELVPMSVIQEDSGFYEYIYKSNCLYLPDQVRVQPERHSPDDTLMAIFSLMKNPPPDAHSPHSFKSGVLSRHPEYLEKASNLERFRNVYDWHMMFLSSAKNSSDLKIFLSKINQCNLFCSALNKPFDGQALPIRCKRLFNMEQFSTAVNNLEHRAMKRVKKAVTIDTPDRMHRNETFYVVGSILFIKEIQGSYHNEHGHETTNIPLRLSARINSGYKYYFSMGKDKKPRSEYYIPEEASLDMVSGYSGRVMWPWEPSASAILDGQPTGGVTRADVEEYISQKVKR